MQGITFLLFMNIAIVKLQDSTPVPLLCVLKKNEKKNASGILNGLYFKGLRRNHFTKYY